MKRDLEDRVQTGAAFSLTGKDKQSILHRCQSQTFSLQELEKTANSIRTSSYFRTRELLPCGREM